jgi:predicted choloylglycine hydrolase
VVATHRRVGRRRATGEEAVVTKAIKTLTDLLEKHNIDREAFDEQATWKFEGLPERYQEEFRGIADVLPVSTTDLHLYALAISDVTDAIADTDTSPEGCTNVVVAGKRTVHGDPLILKNRDVSGAGLRPQRVVTYPGEGGLHGFTTVSTCGSVLVFQGVNDTGLAAANTFVNVNTDTPTEEEVLNGVLVRRLLEECATVAEARRFVAERRLDRLQGLTLALADGTSAAMLEIDPLEPEIRSVSGPVVARTNHYVGPVNRDRSDETASTAVRFARVCDLVDVLPDIVTRADLFAVAEDHYNGPGPNSVCRHSGESTGRYRLDQSTTVSTNVYRGGTKTSHGTIGAPCESSSIELSPSGSSSDEIRTGRYWRETVRDRE